MAFTLNKVQIIGRLARDPKLKEVLSGKIYANVILATTQEWKDENGEIQRKSEFHKVVVPGHFAETISAELHMNDLIFVEGVLQKSDWVTPEGQRKHKTEIISKNLIYLNVKGYPNKIYNMEGADKEDWDL